ncbi:MAG: hypothetical protein ACTS5I_11255, partial [Rhodanobacter sp.]
MTDWWKNDAVADPVKPAAGDWWARDAVAEVPTPAAAPVAAAVPEKSIIDKIKSIGPHDVGNFLSSAFSDLAPPTGVEGFVAPTDLGVMEGYTPSDNPVQPPGHVSQLRAGNYGIQSREGLANYFDTETGETGDVALSQEAYDRGVRQHEDRLRAIEVMKAAQAAREKEISANPAGAMDVVRDTIATMSDMTGAAIDYTGRAGARAYNAVLGN